MCHKPLSTILADEMWVREQGTLGQVFLINLMSSSSTQARTCEQLKSIHITSLNCTGLIAPSGGRRVYMYSNLTSGYNRPISVSWITTDTTSVLLISLQVAGAYFLVPSLEDQLHKS